MRRCPCGTELPVTPGVGRPRSYCSSACRQRAYRARRVPAVMQGRRWVRAAGKRPVTVDGHAASVTDPGTWSTYRQVVMSRAGDGYGVMLGGGLGCYDLDGVTDDEARRFVATVSEPVVMVERSLSGRGVHVFVEAPEAPGWRRMVDGLSVERYARDRFIRVTGDRLYF